MKRLYSKVSEQLGTTDVVAQWRSDSDLLAVAGWKRRVTIYDRAGTALADINLPDPDIDYDSRLNSVVALEWHPSGEYLAVLPRGQHFAMVWSASTHEVARVDADIKAVEACFLMWRTSRPQLLLGSTKGSAVVYDCAGRSITQLHAKLGKAICSGAWVDAGGRSYLALGCKDQHIAWFDPDSATLLRIISLRGVPADIRAYAHPGGKQVLVSAAVGRRSLLLWQLPLAVQPDPPAPMELTFQDRYGELESHLWLEGGMVLAGFRSGQVAVVDVNAAHGSHGTEVFSSRLLPYGISSLSYCAATQQVALAGGAAVGVLQWDGQQRAREVESDWAELDGGQQVAQVQWSPDGQLLTVTTKGGKLHQYLVKAPSLHAVDGTRVAYTTSLTDVTVVDLKSKQLPAIVRLRTQPDTLSLGPLHLAAISGAKVAYHCLMPGEDSLLPPPEVVEYPVPIQCCHLNQSHAVLLGEGGQVYVQSVAGEGSIVELRGEDGESCQAACISLTQRYIITGLHDGTLTFYDCDAQALLSAYHHSGGSIASMHPDAAGTKLVLQDGAGAVYLYNAVDDDLIQPPNFEGKLTGAVWHSGNPNLLVLLSDAGTLCSYVYIASSVEGRGLKFLGEQAKPQGAVPLVLHGDCLTCRLPAGCHEDVRIPAFAALEQATTPRVPAEDAKAVWRARCHQALSVCHLSEALAAAKRCGEEALLREVAVTALHLLEVPIALAAYEAAGDDGAAAELRPLIKLEDHNLQAGRVIAVLGGDVDRAQALLLASSQPLAALELRKGLGHWQEAQRLAQELDPTQAGLICAAKAQALEAEGQFQEAAAHFKEALGQKVVAEDTETALACKAGLARCSIQAGDCETGIQLALQIGDPALCVQCADWLEVQQQAKGAGKLYTAVEQFDRAAELYLSCREFRLVDDIISRTSDPAVRLHYAEAKEDLGSFHESASAYVEAGEPLRAVRVYLQRLGDVQAAIKTAEGFPEGALLIAKHCAAARQFKLAMQQYCLAGSWDEAFGLARQQGEMQAFCDQVRTSGQQQQALRLADHFEGQGVLAQAAEFAAVGKQYERAARLYLQAGGDSVKQAIALAAAAKDAAAVAVVVQHLQAAEGMAERLVELHLVVGQPRQACAVAVARARVEQANGNYKVARDQLLKVCAALQERRAAATPELVQALTLLQSYLLVKTLVRLGDHLGAARMLLRVADSIASFPKHVVPILTSTVIECHRAGLYASGHKWANVLVQPQHMALVAEPYKKKIEGIAKLPNWDAEEPRVPDCECLFCGTPGPETQLSCAQCSASLPFCLATGMRLTLTDASECPCCHFPCRGTALAVAVGRERVCPLCEQEVAVHAIKKIFDPISHLRRTVFGGLPGSGRQQR